MAIHDGDAIDRIVAAVTWAQNIQCSITVDNSELEIRG